MQGGYWMEEFVRIAVLENDVEAQLVDSILNERNVPHLIQSYHDTAFDGMYQVTRGWGVISAPLQYRDEIMEIIDDLRAVH